MTMTLKLLRDPKQTKISFTLNCYQLSYNNTVGDITHTGRRPTHAELSFYRVSRVQGFQRRPKSVSTVRVLNRE